MGDEAQKGDGFAAQIKQTLRYIEDLEGGDPQNNAASKALFDLKRDLEGLIACNESQTHPSSIEKTLHKLISQSPDCLYLQDRDRRYVWFSNERPFGFDSSALLGKTEGECFPPAEAERLKAVKEKAIETGSRARIEQRITRDGRTRILDIIYDPWLDEAGNILGLAGYARDVTDKKQAEEETRKMTTAVEMTPAAIVLTDLEGKIEYVNPALLRDAGFQSASEIIGRSVYEFTNREGKSKFDDEIVPALFSCGQWEGELTLQKKDGNAYITEMICALIRDEHRNPSHFLANFYNITERKRAEVALLLDDSRLEALQILGQMDDASLQDITDFALEAGVKLTGSRLGYLAFVSDDEMSLVMHSWSKGAMQECRIKHRKMVYALEDTGLWGEALRQRKGVITNDYPSCPQKKGTPHGHVKISRHMNIPIIDKGKVVIVAGVGNKSEEYDDADVRQLTLLMTGMWKLILRRKTEEALKESQRTLATLMSNLPGMAYRCQNNRDWTMEFVSDGCLELTGYRAEELVWNAKASYAMLIHPLDRDYVWNEVQDALREGKPYRMIYRINTRPGTKWVWEQGRGIFNSEKEVIALEGFINDITERKLAEESLRTAHQELEKRVQERTDWLLRANIALHDEMAKHRKTEEELRRAREAADGASKAKSEFLANMSHEIRTPMNAVIGLTDLMLETDLTTDQRDFAETIRSSGDALLAIINDILDFSKIDEGKMNLENCSFNLRECIESSLDLVGSKAAEKGLVLTYELEEGVPSLIRGDNARLRQILTNLLSNAVKFTDAGRVSVIAGRASQLDMIEFTICDTGIGISPKDMGKLFLSFSQVDTSTSRKYGGTGLGLAISRRLVELMGGCIWAESELSVGSKFHFTILAKPALAECKDRILAGKRMLAVVNDEACLTTIRDNAHNWGMSIYPAISAAEAHDMESGRIDVAVLDARVPEAAGLRLELQKTLPVIVLDNVDKCDNNVELREDKANNTEKTTKTTIERGKREANLQEAVSLLNLHSALQMALAPKCPKTGASGDAALRGNLKILLAEDNLVNRKVALLMLKKLGCCADVAGNGLEVLQALKRRDYDVILMDVQMPEMDGLKAARFINDMKLKRRPVIIAMTAYALEGDKQKCLDAGMDGYLSKPVQLEELRSALDGLPKKHR
ncbi:MAG: PAS domain S-box protein [Methanothrix sp.]|nr:MAG: PAS domain S-box protein [Methanothrix sp.]